MASIEARIWDIGNPSECAWSVSVSRVYKDGDQWKRTAALHPKDLFTQQSFAVEKVWDAACQWIWKQLQAATYEKPSV
jgi:hypothetical protein